MSQLQNLEPTAVKAFSIPDDAPPAVISDLKGVASYNWMDNQGAVSMAIPGKILSYELSYCEDLISRNRLARSLETPPPSAPSSG
jgi:hypothetical protein